MTEHELYHFGILGMKWGVRRYQNPDGTLTSAGRKRYSDSDYSPQQNPQSNQQSNNFQSSQTNQNQNSRITSIDTLSNQELEYLVRRAELNNKLATLTADDPKVKRGREHFRENIQTIGSVIALGTSAVALASAISKYRLQAQKVVNTTTKAASTVAKVAK